MSTFSEKNYLPITVYEDGMIEHDDDNMQIFDLDEEMKKTAKQIKTAVTAGDVKILKEKLQDLLDLQKLISDLWEGEDDEDEFE